MKKILLTAIILLSGLSMAQNINFKSTSFERALIDVGVDTNGDGKISKAEAEAVTTLVILGTKGTKTLPIRLLKEDLAHFKNLKIFRMYAHMITWDTDIDFSGNTKLEELRLFNPIKVTSVDVRGLKNLKTFWIEKDRNAIKRIYFGDHPNMETIKIKGATKFEGFSDGSRTLDCSVFPKLDFVNIDDSRINKVNIDNPKLEKFYANNAYLEFLDLSKAPRLKVVDVRRNLLKVLNVANGNNANFTVFQAEIDNEDLTCIKVDNGFYPPNSWTKNGSTTYNSDCGCDHPLIIPDPKFEEALLTTKDEDKNGILCQKEADKIITLGFWGTDIKTVSGVEYLKNLEKFWLLGDDSQIQYLDLSKNPKLQEISVTGKKIRGMSTRNLKELKVVHAYNMPDFSHIFHPYVGDFIPDGEHPKLERLTINKVAIPWIGPGMIGFTMTRDLSTFPSLKVVDFTEVGSASKWKFNDAVSLEQLSIANSSLDEEIKVDKLVNLKKLEIVDKYVEKIDLTKNAKLREVIISGSKITSLDLSKNKDLGKEVKDYCIFCSSHDGKVFLKGNKLKSLNLANGTNYQMTDVDLTGNSQLKCVKIDASFIPPATWKKDNQTAFSNNCGMGVAEVADQAFRIYPNPVQDVLYIDSDKTVESVTVYDANGRLVFTKEGVNQVNVSALHAGVYIVQVVIDGQKVSKKIIKK